MIHILTGAYDVGKSATLDFLDRNLGYSIQEEAFKILQRELGPEVFFHPPDQPYIENTLPNHICPRCKPKEFTELILGKQLELERNCRYSISIFERGFCDSLALLRWTGAYGKISLNFRIDLFAKYRLVFLLDVMDEIQEAKWGKSKQIRAKEARDINELIFKEYLRYGFRVVIIPPGTISERAILIETLIKNEYTVPLFGIVDYSDRYDNILSQIRVNPNGNNILRTPPFLFRVTSGRHLFKVLNHGTDRAGFNNEMHWREQGYTGSPRKFEDVIFASTEQEIIQGMTRSDLSTSFKKIPITPDPYILVYDASKFERVHREHQYAFRDASNKKKALLSIIKIKTAR